MQPGSSLPRLFLLRRSIVSACGWLQTSTMMNPSHSREAVIAAIETWIGTIMQSFANREVQSLWNGCRMSPIRNMGSFKRIILILTRAHYLLKANKAATQREIYYSFKKDFETYRKCVDSILKATRLLGVPHHCLGIYAVARGKNDIRRHCHLRRKSYMSHLTILLLITGLFCGSIMVTMNSSNIDASNIDVLSDGISIFREWIVDPENIDIHSVAKCILVIEKETIYQQLV